MYHVVYVPNSHVNGVCVRVSESEWNNTRDTTTVFCYRRIVTFLAHALSMHRTCGIETHLKLRGNKQSGHMISICLFYFLLLFFGGSHSFCFTFLVVMDGCNGMPWQCHQPKGTFTCRSAFHTNYYGPNIIWNVRMCKAIA